jgi:hypothetical protein
MKRVIFTFFVLSFFTLNAYASGSADMQSRALLYRQQRTTWPNAPESAIFYECYLLVDREKTLLLDVFLKDNSQEKLLIIDTNGVMEIIAHNASSMLRRPKTIYKCVVLESGQLMGMAIVNIFSAEPMSNNYGILYPNFIGYNFNFSSIFWYYSDEYDYSSYPNNEDERIIVIIPNSSKTYIINQWPNPSDFFETDLFALLDESYNNFLRENTELSDHQKQLLEEIYNKNRSQIQELIDYPELSW